MGSVPLFDKVKFRLDEKTTFTIRKDGEGKKIQQINYGDEPVDGWFITHDQLKQGKELVITTE